MRLRPAFVLVSSVSCGAWLFAQGCGGDTATTDDGGSDGTTGGDTGNPPPPDSGNPDVIVTPDTGAPDTGGGDGGVQPDSSSSGLVFACGDGGTVTDCSQCQGATEPCVYCEIGDASVLTAQCRAFGSSCGFNPLPPTGYGSCPCAGGDASTCPESYQVCRSFGGNQYVCRTCSDSQNNNTLKCKSGGTCDSADGGCI